MLYYTKSARESAINDIKKCIETINTTSGDVISYHQASKITRHLNDLIRLIEKEGKENTK